VEPVKIVYTVQLNIIILHCTLILILLVDRADICIISIHYKYHIFRPITLALSIQKRCKIVKKMNMRGVHSKDFQPITRALSVQKNVIGK
jgi:hypothetical protein